MVFEKKPDGLWHGHFRYNGQLLTASDPSFMRCIWILGSKLNEITGTIK